VDLTAVAFASVTTEITCVAENEELAREPAGAGVAIRLLLPILEHQL
jgi:hypothetical protein